MNVQSRKQYTAEFKEQIIKLAERGKAVSELAEEFGISAGLIHTWRRKATRAPQLRSAVAGAEGDQDLAQEVRRLRRQVAELQLDNEILKKAALILGTHPPRGIGK